ncbi:hypothetical protein BJV77DRAFT_955002, partial [Russula vinacea]
REVPIPMVALVATALYAAINEWRTGIQVVAEFSASAYLDVYRGHIDTFDYIKEHRISCYHTTLAEIYRQAR